MTLEEICRTAVLGPAFTTLEERVRVADRVREAARSWVASAATLGAVSAISVQCSSLPASFPFVVIDEAVLCRAECAAAEQEVAALCGVASVLWRRLSGSYTSADVWLLAAELAAPSAFLAAAGVTGLLAIQSRVPKWLLEAYASALPAAPTRKGPICHWTLLTRS